MKSRTLYFNSTAFKKDVTRFAPTWVLYTVLLLMGFATIMDYSTPLYRTENIVTLISVAGLLNFCYALVTAQLLFGDLCNSRLCSALHAMPLRRECWFGTHVSAGMLFSIVPNLTVGLLSIALLDLGKGWIVPLWWILASFIQYLFFFSLAVLCMMLVGNRFAQVLVYGIVNFFSPMVYWLVDSLYEPLLHGIRVPADFFMLTCPVYKMASGLELVEVVRRHVYKETGGIEESFIDHIAIGSEWVYMIVCALLGIALLGLALVLYRKRKLESAGDFIAFRFMEPIFLIFYTICAGAFLHLFSDIFGGVDLLFLAIGITVGFFTGLMLLRRTTRIFRKKAFVHFAIFVAVFALTLVLTWLDPLKITQKIPKAEEVKSVTLSNSSELTYRGECEVTLTDPDAIRDMLEIHRSCLKGGESDLYHGNSYNVLLRLEYTLRDGSTMNRFYQLGAESPAAQIAEGYYSSIECVLGITEEEIPQFAEKIENVFFHSRRDNTGNLEELNIDLEEMLRAIAADCAEGNMAQIHSYHYNCDTDTSSYVTLIEFELYRDIAEYRELGYRYYSIAVYEEARHTLAWMEANDLMPEEPDPKYG